MEAGSRSGGQRRSRGGVIALAFVLLLAVAATPARADVSQPAVDPNVPTNAAGGRTVYTITFSTGALGDLSASANSHITIDFPAGTDLTNVINSQVYDTTTAPNTQIGNCSMNA